MEIVEFKRELDEYIHEVEGSNNEQSRAFYFLKFIQKVFNKGSSPELEKYVKLRLRLLGYDATLPSCCSCPC
jgi:hypothetical protein